jgi:hypothetical protein
VLKVSYYPVSEYISANLTSLGGVSNMYRTITIGSCIAIQGLFIRALKNGKIAIKVGSKEFVGKPIETYSK